MPVIRGRVLCPGEPGNDVFKTITVAVRFIPTQADSNVDEQPPDTTLFYSIDKKANIDLSVLYNTKVTSLSCPCL